MSFGGLLASSRRRRFFRHAAAGSWKKSGRLMTWIKNGRLGYPLGLRFECRRTPSRQNAAARRFGSDARRVQGRTQGRERSLPYLERNTALTPAVILHARSSAVLV